MQTNYKILIFRKQVLLQQIKYTNEFVHSYSLQNKYFLQEKSFWMVIVCSITFKIDSTLSI